MPAWLFKALVLTSLVVYRPGSCTAWLFLLTDEALEVVDCGGNFTAATGTITSPAHPRYYAANLTCHWLITVDVGLRISLTIPVFVIEDDNDVLEVILMLCLL